jgi:hypothetical protein
MPEPRARPDWAPDNRRTECGDSRRNRRGLFGGDTTARSADIPGTAGVEDQKAPADADGRADAQRSERRGFMTAFDSDTGVFLSRRVVPYMSKPHYVLTVMIAAHEDGTEVTWNQQFEDVGVASRIRHIVEPANEQNLDRLVSVLAGEPVLPEPGAKG